MNRPRARRDDLLTTALEDEVVVYDPDRKQAHSLSRVAMAAWNHCDGATSIDDLRQAVADETGLNVDEEAVCARSADWSGPTCSLTELATAGL